ncbi:tripartite tricarboxylate transporter substrate binding protein [Alcaligenaceae bacterium]|nr:tripartite tricarboxylate transporter substrate binding protein [Alcaligenaceae bacterium]
MKKFKVWGLATAIVLFNGAANVAHAALPQCPSGAVKVVVPNPAGAGGDILTRLLSEKVGAALGQNIVIENRAGATTTIGTANVARSTPDGCTMLSLTASGVVASVFLDKLPYELTRDLRPIAKIGSVPMALAVPIGSNINSIDDLAKIAKSPDGLMYASGGVGTLAHLSTVRLLNAMQGEGHHIPFKGNPDATQALLGNHVQMFFLSVADGSALEASGKAKILAVTAKERLPMFPNTPTLIELGFKDLAPSLWYGYLAPAKTPDDTIDQLYKAFASAVNDPEIQGKLKNMGFTIDLQDPDGLRAFMGEEAQSWGKVIRDNNIQNGS